MKVPFGKVGATALAVLLLLCGALLLCGCPSPGEHHATPIPADGPKVLPLNFDDPSRPIVSRQQIQLGAARNETVSFALQISRLPRAGGKTPAMLRLQPLQLQSENASIPNEQFSVYQVLPMPVDVNQAGYVRHTGLKVSSQMLPRALLPVPVNQGAVNLAALRDSRNGRNPNSRAGGADGAPVMLWVDLNVPVSAKVGDYLGACDILENGQVVSRAEVALSVYDFVLPDERHLLMVGELKWDTLTGLWPELFEAITPNLLSRKDPRYADTLRVLDQLVKLGQENRVQVVTPRLEPLVKWPAGQPPQVEWDAFDTVVSPWLNGDAFADHIPLGYWPLPWTQYLDRYDYASQGQYWQAAAAHFDFHDWLERAPVSVPRHPSGRADIAQSMRLSQAAQRILAAHPKLRALTPLEDEQLQFRSDQAPSLLEKTQTERLVAAAPGMVFPAPSQPWPIDLDRPQHWLRTDLPGLVPYIGAGGDEHDVRLWAWLAFLRRATIIEWNQALPAAVNPDEPADPAELIWFYPGRWFGVDRPVPSIQLKWLRRAEQDYEYLYLAKERGEVTNALVMARLITKPVEIQPMQRPDPTYALMCGTTDAGAWEEARKLLARTILIRPPGKQENNSDQIRLNVDTLNWVVPQEKPLLMGRNAQWGWGVVPQANGNWVDLRLGLDIYNASDQRLTGDLRWVVAPPGWQIHPQPITIGPDRAINTYNIEQFSLDASIDLDRLGLQMRQPLQLLFTNRDNGRASPLQLILPACVSARREGQLKLDGTLSDWSEADAILDNQPMVRMLDRPMVQQQAIQPASTPSSIYTTWAASNFYVGFKLAGLSDQTGKAEKNFVDYQFRRAWGEDLCEVLIQPVYANNALGPVLHVVCKPRGQVLVERQGGAGHAQEWEEIVAANIRYATTSDGGAWRGEIAIPWSAIDNAAHQGVRPTLLRFNFSQHQTSTGESASWAGPIDFGRDESFMGLLYLREVRNEGEE